MDLFFRYVFSVLLSLFLYSIPVSARPVNRVPLCLQFPDSKTYVPCTGVLPVDPETGEPLSWAQAMGNGSGTNNVVTRRSHWTETQTPLSANGQFIGLAHDDESPSSGGISQWTNFSCFAWADQAGTLEIQTSVNGTTWISIQSRTWQANDSLYIIQPIFTKYSRCKVTNGATAQSSFILYSAFGL